MIKGIHAAEASMRPKLARLDVLANNLANITTTGFKKDRVFVQMLKDSAAAQAEGKGDLDGLSVRHAVDFSEGPLQNTGNPLDLAIQGRGFFVVEGRDGVRYTRNGGFTLSADGVVTTHEGYVVQGVQGPIRFPDMQRLEKGNVSVSETGEIAVDKQVIGVLRVVDFLDVSQLRKDHQSLFVAGPDVLPVERREGSLVIRQGHLEGSNVEGIEEMIALVELSRAFETDQRVIAAQDESLQKAIDMGRL
jgi:flagellar basal-body rod protein FlgG